LLLDAKMRQISPYSLWIGDAVDGRDFRTLAAKRIRVMVQIASEEPTVLAPRELVYLRFPIRNDEKNTFALLRTAIAAVTGLLERGVPTLVFCGAGMSRARVIVAASLASLLHADLGECLGKVAKEHSRRASPALLADVGRVVETWQVPQNRLAQLEPFPLDGFFSGR